MERQEAAKKRDFRKQTFNNNLATMTSGRNSQNRQKVIPGYRS